MSSYEEQAQADRSLEERGLESEEPRDARLVSTSMSLGHYLSMYEAIIRPPVPVAAR